jgi:hypothetical protein
MKRSLNNPSSSSSSSLQKMRRTSSSNSNISKVGNTFDTDAGFDWLTVPVSNKNTVSQEYDDISDRSYHRSRSDSSCSSYSSSAEGFSLLSSSDDDEDFFASDALLEILTGDDWLDEEDALAFPRDVFNSRRPQQSGHQRRSAPISRPPVSAPASASTLSPACCLALVQEDPEFLALFRKEHRRLAVAAAPGPFMSFEEFFVAASVPLIASYANASKAAAADQHKQEQQKQEMILESSSSCGSSFVTGFDYSIQNWQQRRVVEPSPPSPHYFYTHHKLQQQVEHEVDMDASGGCYSAAAGTGHQWPAADLTPWIMDDSECGDEDLHMNIFALEDMDAVHCC